MVRAWVVLATWLAAAPAWAEQEPGAPRVPTSTVTATSTATDILDERVPSPPPAPPCPNEAEAIYDAAFEALVDDDLKRALELFSQVQRLCPNHRLAPEMKRYAAARADKLGIETSEVELEPGVERPSLLAWGELIAFQTLHGAAQGALLCGAAGCEGARAFALAGVAGAAAGAGLSIFGFKRVRSGQASAINSGTGWGIWNSIALVELIEPDGRASLGLVSGVMAAGTLAGVGAALLLEPKNGDVSFANSTGIWLGMTAFWILLAGEVDFQKTIIPIELAVTNLGLIGGAVASQWIDMSRGRVLIIDAGGIVGGLLGLGIAAIINTDFPPTLFGPLAAVGTVGGLIGTFFLTIPIDEPDEEESSWWIAPSGAGAVVGARF